MIASNLMLPERIGPQSNGMLMTPEEFDAAEDWDEFYKYELIHGVLVVNPPPDAIERDPNDDLGHLIRQFQDVHPNGCCVDKTLPEQTLRLGSNRRRCDRAIWIGLGRRPNDKVDTPKVVVEFPGKRARDRRRDYVVKPQEYAAAGIEEYWIINMHRKEMTVHRLGGETLTLGPGEVYRTPLMPGFELPLDRLFAVAEPEPDSEEQNGFE